MRIIFLGMSLTAAGPREVTYALVTCLGLARWWWGLLPRGNTQHLPHLLYIATSTTLFDRGCGSCCLRQYPTLDHVPPLPCPLHHSERVQTSKLFPMDLVDLWPASFVSRQRLSHKLLVALLTDHSYVSICPATASDGSLKDKCRAIEWLCRMRVRKFLLADILPPSPPPGGVHPCC